MAALEHQLRVDLVGDDPQVVLAGQGGHPLQLLDRGNGPGRVVRGVEDHGPGRRADRAGQQLGVDAEAGVGVESQPGQGGPASPEGGVVGEVHRVEGDDLVALLQEAQRGREQGVLGTGEGHDVLRAPRPAGLGREAGRDQLPQVRPANDLGVVGVARPQGVDRSVDDGFGGGEVRIADGQDDDVLTPFTGLPGFEQGAPAVGPLAGQPVGHRCVAHGPSVLAQLGSDGVDERPDRWEPWGR